MTKVFLLLFALLPAAGRAQEAKVVSQVLDLIDKYYVEPVDAKKLKTIAERDGLPAVFNELDPYSAYLAPQVNKELNTSTAGTFGGIGMMLQEIGGGFSVQGTLPGTPAYRGGIMAGEKIVAVDGRPTAGSTLPAVVDRLRGTPGTTVKITLAAEGVEGQRDVSITREVIKIESARGRMIAGKTGYLQISQFSATTAEDARRALEDLKADGMKSLVLDLRNNPGGLLSVAVDVAGLFLDAGKLVTYTQGRAPESRKDFNTPKIGLFADVPMALLINGGTAAGAEILTGALQDYERGRVIGSRTYGKGSVQSLYQLSDGGSLKLTIQRYRTPKGRMIERGRSTVAGGFIPDVAVEVSPEQETASRDYLENLLKGALIPAVDPKREPVLARGLEALKAGAPAVSMATIKPQSEPRPEPARPEPAHAEPEEALPPAVPPNPDALAVVFGIESYKKVGGVSFAKRDAESFKRYAVNLLGVPDSKNHIYFLTEDVTLAEFKKAFGNNGWLARRVKPASDVYVYYAGHGAPDLDSKRGFLVPADGDPNYAGETGYPIEDLYKFLDGLKAHSVSLFLDSCFSGADRENKMLLAQARPLVVQVKAAPQTKNLVVFSAASGSQISSGYVEKQHGLFTYFLLKGMKGDADSNGDRRVTAGELSEFLKAKVGDAAAGMDREQVPELNGDPARVIVRARKP